MNTLKAIIWSVSRLSDRQQMQISMSNPRNLFHNQIKSLEREELETKRVLFSLLVDSLQNHHHFAYRFVAKVPNTAVEISRRANECGDIFHRRCVEVWSSVEWILRELNTSTFGVDIKAIITLEVVLQ